MSYKLRINKYKCKLKKLFGDLETDYLDGFQYKSTFLIESWNGEGMFVPDPNEVPELKLRIIPTAEGYYDALLNQYVYNFTDHLGNVRLSYTDTNKDGIMQPRQYSVTQCIGRICNTVWKPGEIVDVNNYYPFGMLHEDKVTQYTYRADGSKLKKLFGDLETDYLDGFQYKSTFLIESWNGKSSLFPNYYCIRSL